ncbi:2-succinylbenzoate--CoA ligase [Lentibacillus kapialis]|uniref:2-succinylbenzoate--CoA ligase n=1 Tax=Lentibacillus kapialis TaxID=340214 RepID=A0A917PYQ2_9BACI|nr:o-succinylbenzoate--CoA ligase [Lentibacillus kapialis]GGJ99673.1 2-succinylbenzoate--CoA ligase [Lentibacillus kapialis]
MTEIIPHWLTKQADLAPEQTAIELTNGTTYTFLELKEKSQSFARKLQTLGVRKSAKIGILSTNHIDMVIAIHALSYLGAVGVMLNVRLTEKELNYQLNDAGVELVLTQDNEKMLDSKIASFSDVWNLHGTQSELSSEIHLNEIFTIIYTSGTTGFPKGVMHTYGNHWWSAVGSMLNLGLSKHDKWLAALPMFHVSGLSILLRSVIYGIPVFMLEKYDKHQFHEALMKKGVTIASVVTMMLRDLISQLGDDRYPETLRCLLLGGGPAPESLLEKAKDYQIPVFQSYGMTETSSQIVTLSPGKALEKIGSSGKPLFPAQLKINAPKAQIGEIYVKGPMVTKGYFNNADETRKSLEDGWLATGDLGYTDAEGFLYIVDRRKDLIISGGENIYPSEIEKTLSAMEGIRDIGVIGKANGTWGQIPVAFVAVEHSTVLTADNILTFAEKHLAKYKVPKEIYFLNQLPRNASNKLVRHQLKDHLTDNDFQSH